MKHHYLIIAALLSAQVAVAQNRVNLTLTDGNVQSYATGQLTSIDFSGAEVTVNPVTGSPTAFNGTVRGISFQKIAEGAVVITEAQGWLESAYAEWQPMEGASDYRVYIKGGNYAAYTPIDQPLVRTYGSYVRADMVGLKAGSYTLKVVPVIAGSEAEDKAAETGVLTVTNYQRAGFAHKDYQGVGAYNDDGTLKAGAVVIYVSAATAKTVTAQLSSGSFTGIQSILSAYEKGNVTTPLAVRVIGTLNAGDVDRFGSSAEGLQVKGRTADNVLNITIEGIGEDATIKGFGFLVRNSKSVEFRNLGIMRQMDDGISLDTDNSNIWVHHMDVFYGKAGSGDHAKGDGSIDVKSDSKFVTIDHCHFWDTGKSSMAGMTSESGPNYITYHHNWFDHSDSRHARIRTMSVHLWNNYYDGVSKYGIGATMGSSVFAENNYFRHAHDPLLISLQGTDARGTGTFSGEAGGMIKAYGNIFAETGGSSYYEPITWAQNNTSFDCYEVTDRTAQLPETVVTLSGGNRYNNFDTNASLMYAYTPDAAADVPTVVTGYYGAGRLNHGDLQYTFNNATDDTDYGVNKTLAALIDAYTGYTPSNSGTTEPVEPVVPTDPTDPTDPTTPTDSGISASVLCSFDKNGVPSSNLFTVVGNGSNSKGTATYNGVSYNTCLKMESTTSVKFTLAGDMALTVVFGDTETTSFKLNGNKLTGSASTYTLDLEAGSYEITKADVRNLFLIELTAK